MKYKNISDQTLTVPEIGTVAPGGIVEAPAEFRNANFEAVKEKEQEKNKE